MNKMVITDKKNAEGFNILMDTCNPGIGFFGTGPVARVAGLAFSIHGFSSNAYLNMVEREVKRVDKEFNNMVDKLKQYEEKYGKI